MAGNDDEIEELLKSAKRRSPVYEWLDLHYQKIRRNTVAGNIAWAPIANYLNERGIFDGQGKPVTAERLTKTWLAVKRARSRNLLVEEDRPSTAERPVPVETRVAAVAVAASRSQNIGPGPALVEGRVPFKPGSRVARSVEENIEQSRASMRAQDAWVGDMSVANQAREEANRLAAVASSRLEEANKKN